MKKILYVLLLTMIPVLISCEENKPKVIENKETIKSGDYEIIKEFTYKGHHYISFQEGFSYYSWGGIVHDPECPCHKDTLNIK